MGKDDSVFSLLSEDGSPGEIRPHDSVLDCCADSTRSPCAHVFSTEEVLYRRNTVWKAVNVKQMFYLGMFDGEDVVKDV